jgi:hypothetical protein
LRLSVSGEVPFEDVLGNAVKRIKISFTENDLIKNLNQYVNETLEVSDLNDVYNLELILKVLVTYIFLFRVSTMLVIRRFRRRVLNRFMSRYCQLLDPLSLWTSDHNCSRISLMNYSTNILIQKVNCLLGIWSWYWPWRNTGFNW